MRKQYRKEKKDYTKLQRKYFILKIALTILLVTSLGSFLMWQNIEGLALNKRLKKAQKEAMKIQNLYYEKLIEYERLKKDDRIKKKARKLLNMQSTKKDDFRLLGIKDKDKLIKELIKAEPKKD